VAIFLIFLVFVSDIRKKNSLRISKPSYSKDNENFIFHPIGTFSFAVISMSQIFYERLDCNSVDRLGSIDCNYGENDIGAKPFMDWFGNIP
jgi:hypothetical protein